MLLEFSCTNHKSIREEILFSALAGSDTTYEEKTQEFVGHKILKSAVIYGAIFFPNDRQAKIFERKGENFITGSKFREKLSTCKNVLKPNRLLLTSCYHIYAEFRSWFERYRGND